MPLGWSLFGKQVTTNTQKECIYSVNRINIVRNDDLIHNSVKQFWEYEECINANSQETTMPMSNIKCLRKLTRETKFTNGKYEVPMLWKESCEELPDNYQIALQRLKLLQRRFKRNDKLFRMCKKAIDTYVTQGYTRKMTEEIPAKSRKTWYLPHHPVFHPQKTGKFRAVFDVASTIKEESLNENLHTDPHSLNSLIGVLFRFQNYKIALVADVEGMFHQVKVSKSDMDSLTFLWANHSFQSQRIDTFQMTVHIFGATDSPCCRNYALKSVGRDHHTEFSLVTIETILKPFYADNLLKSVVTKQEAINLVKELIEATKKG